MRNPKKISKILKEIEKIWKKNPNLRLGQLIMNVYEFQGVLYYVGDEKLIQLLKEFYEK